MLRPGDTAPAFTLPDHTGAPVTLAGLLTAGPLILFFYPADFTPICTAEACAFRDAYAELAAAGFSVAGISPQAPESKSRFRVRHALPYPLLADPTRATIRAYGAATFLGLPLPFGVRRVTYLISPQATVVDALTADLRIAPHEAFLRRLLPPPSGEVTLRR